VRIALFLSAPQGGGAQRRLLGLARGFLAAGCEVDLLFASPPQGGAHLSGLERARVFFLGSPLARRPAFRHRRALWVPLAARALARHLRADPADVLLATSLAPNLTAALACPSGARPALVLSVNLHPSAALGRSGGRLIGLPQLVARAYARADVLIAISEGIAADLERLLPRYRPPVQVVPVPVDVEQVRRAAALPPEPAIPALRGRRFVLGCGKLRPQKDFATLIRAFAGVARGRDLALVILGEGPMRPRLLHLAARLGVGDRVFLPGFAANPFAWMARAAVFALSSRFEGASNVLLEALAAGCPIVSTDCPSGPREILDGGRFGALVPVGDVTAMAAALERALENPGDAEARLARARGFAPSAIVSSYLQILRAARATRSREERAAGSASAAAGSRCA